MEIKILGVKIRPVIVVLCLLVGMIVGGFALCSCAKITLQQVKEGFEELGANRSYNMSDGVPGSYGKSHLRDITQQLNTNQGPKIIHRVVEVFLAPGSYSSARYNTTVEYEPGSKNTSTTR